MLQKQATPKSQRLINKHLFLAHATSLLWTARDSATLRPVSRAGTAWNSPGLYLEHTWLALKKETRCLEHLTSPFNAQA